MLDNFRHIDINWKSAYQRIPDVRTATHDEKGRKLVVQVAEGKEDLSSVGLSLCVMLDERKMGGRNLFKNTQNIPKNKAVDNNYVKVIVGKNKIYWTQKNTVTSGILMDWVNNTPLPEDYYSMQFMASTIENLRKYFHTNSTTYQCDFDYQELEDGYLCKLTTKVKIPINKTIIYFYGTHPFDEPTEVEFWDFMFFRGTEFTTYSPAPEDLIYTFDYLENGIYELYLPKQLDLRDIKAHLLLEHQDFKITSEPFKINLFEGVENAK